MNIKQIWVPIAGVVLVVMAYRGFGWPGVALVASGIVMWVLLHFTRAMKVLERASSRPIGYCDSAVMLNAQLKPGMALLHVVAMTRAIGELLSPKDEQPEIYRWTDAGASHVTCEFQGGKLARWELVRPPGEAPLKSADSPDSPKDTP
ncbi:MAG: glycerate kinase [Burkholderiales bacterium]|nr:glycerate kinase [Burkholderiales bacterium]